ncbi:hypothetical protein TNCV_4571751 [Trichonephila clavipes]|nr:hypothetical protein TNCV_4571751 [Trichonephila clavipes]
MVQDVFFMQYHTLKWNFVLRESHCEPLNAMNIDKRERMRGSLRIQRELRGSPKSHRQKLTIDPLRYTPLSRPEMVQDEFFMQYHTLKWNFVQRAHCEPLNAMTIDRTLHQRELRGSPKSPR